MAKYILVYKIGGYSNDYTDDYSPHIDDGGGMYAKQFGMEEVCGKS
jgi:hypothetical protein